MKRILVILAVIAWIAGPLEAQAPAGTLEQIGKTGKIRIGYRKTQPPMSFLDQHGKPAGYTIEICNRIVAGIKNKTGKEIAIEYIPVTADDRFNALVKNKIDILCGSTTKTLSRAERVDFTQLTFVTGASLMTMKEKGIRDLASLSGKKIGVVHDTTTAQVLKKLLRETLTDAEIVTLNSTGEGVELPTQPG